MKKFFSLLVLALSLIFTENKLAAQDFENAGAYMSFIGKQHQTIAKRFLAYNSASSHGKKAKKVETLKAKLLDEIQESRMNISGMPAFEKDKAYRDSAVSFMKLYYNALNEDYSKIVNMEEIAEQSYDLMEAYLLAKEMVDKKMDDASAALHAAQKQFAATHNINLINSTDEIGEMMKKVNETSNYYSPIYLIFFKSFKQEAYMIDAISKKNINGIEQNKNSLLQFSQDGLVKLAKISSFQGDNSLLSNCKRILEFYITEATEKIPAVSDYFLKQEAFEKMNKDFEKKSSPTADEVATFNRAVKEINNAVKTYNTNNNFLNQSRSGLLNNWNSAVDAYFDNHMPTYN
ncbi:MAG: hypothetical protein ABIN01_16375 [Ferruginibacter sp.]